LEVAIYSPVSNDFGVIFLIFRESRHSVAKANRIRPIPAAMTNPTGTEKVHLTIPIPLRNNAVNGLIIRLHTINPIMEDTIMVGINDSAVCRISCPVVKPRDFSIP